MQQSREIYEIESEIYELETVKKCLFYYLASSLSIVYPEGVSVASDNMEVIRKNLAELYLERKAKKLDHTETRESCNSNATLSRSEDDVKALRLFNKHEGFYITE